MSRAGSALKTHFDWVLVILVLLICGVGLINLYSSSAALGESLHVTQAIWLASGFVLAAVTASIDYQAYQRWAYVFYGFVVFLLVAVLVVGTRLNGAQRWLDFGVFLIQPSELMKLAIIVVTARYFSDQPRHDMGYGLLELWKPSLLLGFPVVLIGLQPDLGTALVVAFIMFTMVLFEGLRTRSLAILSVGAAIGTPLAWVFLLKDYQKGRVLSFLDLEKDPFGPGWQVRQALIALGSGGLTGKGHLQGTQVQKGFVPYHESDFAPVNWGEEHGFVGMLFLIGLYFALIGWALRIGRTSRDRFGMLLSVGIAALVFWHVVVNLGMVMGMLPVVGLTLPLISYGGSSVMTFLFALGLLMGVSLRRHSFNS